MEISEFLKEPLFWFVSAIGTIILSIISNILTPLILKVFSKTSKGRKRKLVSQNLKKREIVINIQSSRDRRISWQVDSIMLGVQGVGLILLFLAISNIISIFIFQEISYFALAIGTIYGYQKILKATMKAKLITIADERAAYQYGEYSEKIEESKADFLVERMEQWDIKQFGVNSKTETGQID
jgi:hypothetical protein